MKWEEIRTRCPHQWLLVEAIEARLEARETLDINERRWLGIRGVQ